MKILINCLTYGQRPLDIIHQNLANAGMDFETNYISVEGIANAMNHGIKDFENYSAIGYLANDIIEPNDWLSMKYSALTSYPSAGIVASSLDYVRTSIQNEHIISNWLIDTNLIRAIGKFNEDFFPYGAIDLDYCERAWMASFQTYYTINCLAKHIGSESTGEEYGWNKSKSELVIKYAQQYQNNIEQYKNGTKAIKI
jgi:GT2 family glycosyltransferase